MERWAAFFVPCCLKLGDAPAVISRLSRKLSKSEANSRMVRARKCQNLGWSQNNPVLHLRLFARVIEKNHPQENRILDKVGQKNTLMFHKMAEKAGGPKGGARKRKPVK